MALAHSSQGFVPYRRQGRAGRGEVLWKEMVLKYFMQKKAHDRSAESPTRLVLHSSIFSNRLVKYRLMYSEWQPNQPKRSTSTSPPPPNPQKLPLSNPGNTGGESSLRTRICPLPKAQSPSESDENQTDYQPPTGAQCWEYTSWPY